MSLAVLSVRYNERSLARIKCANMTLWGRSVSVQLIGRESQYSLQLVRLGVLLLWSRGLCGLRGSLSCAVIVVLLDVTCMRFGLFETAARFVNIDCWLWYELRGISESVVLEMLEFDCRSPVMISVCLQEVSLLEGLVLSVIWLWPFSVVLCMLVPVGLSGRRRGLTGWQIRNAGESDVPNSDNQFDGTSGDRWVRCTSQIRLIGVCVRLLRFVPCLWATERWL